MAIDWTQPVTLLVGGAISAGSGYVAALASIKRSRALAADERAAVALAARDQYLAESFSEVQVAILRLFKAVNVYASRRRAARGASSLTDEERLELREAAGDVAMNADILELLASRVAQQDDDSLLRALSDDVGEVMSEPDLEAWEAKVAAWNSMAHEAQDFAAEQLEKLPPPATYRPLVDWALR